MRTVPAHGSHRLCRNSVLAPLTPFRLIENFQDPEEVATFVKHIKAGLHLLNENADSLLVFSGYVPTLEGGIGLSSSCHN